MAARLLLDTDVLVDYFRGVPEAVTCLESRKEVFLISAVTVGELYAGVREGRERKALDAFMGAFEIVVLDASLASEVACFGGITARAMAPAWRMP